jgi:hypothetical protein
MIGQMVFEWRERRQRRWEQRMAAQWDADWAYERAYRDRIWRGTQQRKLAGDDRLDLF